MVAMNSLMISLLLASAHFNPSMNAKSDQVCGQLLLAGFQAARHVPARSQVVGIWKLDIKRSLLADLPGIPRITDADRKEESKLRLWIGADGTYRATGIRKPQNGRWTLNGRRLTFTGSYGGWDPLTLSADGSMLSEELTIDHKTRRQVYIRTSLHKWPHKK